MPGPSTKNQTSEMTECRRSAAGAVSGQMLWVRGPVSADVGPAAGLVCLRRAGVGSTRRNAWWVPRLLDDSNPIESAHRQAGKGLARENELIPEMSDDSTMGSHTHDRNQFRRPRPPTARDPNS